MLQLRHGKPGRGELLLQLWDQATAGAEVLQQLRRGADRWDELLQLVWDKSGMSMACPNKGYYGRRKLDELHKL
jgi:hypothetical protein